MRAVLLINFLISSLLVDGFSPALTTRRSSSLSMGLKVGDSFPKDALKKFGASGKKSVIFFFGSDDSPSCKKQNSAFDEQAADFKKAGATVIGVRNEAGAKNTPDVAQTLVIDESDAVRNEIGIAKDLFGLLGGRETYVVGKDGTVGFVFNDQFKPEDHVSKALAYVESTAASGGSGGFDLGSFFK
mmetsp:Transcript_22516/g.25965  ORF Transcript_22516/g.25965 Transcript_22516/m.25965 type:complete len:186 (+) Transcript_22516:220-777(+)